ncbi:hypothetical protein ST47_g9813 [Ascochyta rabiei]|uniref:Uncharacterized protein n=1 Tax=Didymella rabiei TaxID=5454 RepID=A0A162WHX2_DIDRA|nr:hypothetical protein ST47_g9813 [Ascochyta rabiei]
MDISKSMYGLLGHKKESLHCNMPQSVENNKNAERARFIEAREDAAAIICREIMRSNHRLCLSNSNRLTLGYAKSSVYTQKPTGNWPEHFPVSIEFTDGRTTLRPLAIHLVTSRPVLFEEAELAPHSANKNKPLPGNYSGAFEAKNVWLVDFEGFCVANKGFALIPSRIDIVNLSTGKSDTGIIKYNFGHIGSIADAIIASGALPLRADCRRVGGVLRRHYEGTKTSGYTMSMWKFRLLDLGFDPKNDLAVSWGFTNFDRLSMGGIMAENSDFAVRNDHIELKTKHMDLVQIFKTYSSIETTALSFLYRTYIKDDHEHRWHDPIYGAMATKELWPVLRRFTEPLFKEMKKRSMQSLVSYQVVEVDVEMITLH